MGYLILFGVVFLAGLIAVTVGAFAGRMFGSTLVASLTSFVLYSGLLLVGGWLLYQSTPPDPAVHDQAAGVIITLGGFCFVAGGGTCALLPIIYRRLTRNL